ncbi:MAG: TolB-like 6-bladed beta-propeller domain-containing protein [Draconibacterium sp.]|nr:TolB-like 6-bladed beta-propeller domain-containing protein [Draconibacterium sp.]
MWLFNKNLFSLFFNSLFITLAFAVSFVSAQSVKKYTANPIPVMKREFDVEKLFAVDNYLIISKNRYYLSPNDYLFRLLKLPEMELICEFGKVGRGPNEFEAQTSHNGIVKVFNDSIQMWLYGINKRLLQHVTLHLTKKNSFLTINKTIKVPYELNLSSPVYLGDSIIAGKVINLDINVSRLRFYDFIKKEVVNCQLITQVKNRNPSDIRYVQSIYNSAFVSSVAYSPENNIFVSAMGYINRIDLYNKAAEHINAIVTPNTILKAKDPENINRWITNNGPDNVKVVGTYYYRSPIVYNNFFAILYLGSDANNARTKENIPCQLRFYDYAGELKAVLNINENINNYTIDEKRGVLYASSRFSGNNYKYDIKQLLDEL